MSSSSRKRSGFFSATLAEEANNTPKFQRARSKSQDRKSSSKKSSTTLSPSTSKPSSAPSGLSQPETPKSRHKRAWRGRGRRHASETTGDSGDDSVPVRGAKAQHNHHDPDEEDHDESTRSITRSLSPQKLRRGLTPVLTPVVKSLRRLSRSAKSQSPRRSRRSQRTARAERDSDGLPMAPNMGDGDGDGTTSSIPKPPAWSPPTNDIDSFLAKAKKRNQRPGLLDETGSRLLPPSGRDVGMDAEGYSLVDDGDDELDDGVSADAASTAANVLARSTEREHAEFTPASSSSLSTGSNTTNNAFERIKKHMPPIKHRKSPQTIAVGTEETAASSKKPASATSVGSAGRAEAPPRPSSQRERRTRRAKRGSEEDTAPTNGGEDSRASTPSQRSSRGPRASSTSRRVFGEILSRATAGRDSSRNSTPSPSKHRDGGRDDEKSNSSRSPSRSNPGGRKRSKSRRSGGGSTASKPTSGRALSESPLTVEGGSNAPRSPRRTKDRSNSLDPHRLAQGAEHGETTTSMERQKRRHSAPMPDEGAPFLTPTPEGNKSVRVRRGRKTPQTPASHASNMDRHEASLNDDSKKPPSSQSISRSHQSNRSGEEPSKPESSRSQSSARDSDRPSSQSSQFTSNGSEEPETPSQRRSRSSALSRRRGRPEGTKPASNLSLNSSSDDKTSSNPSRSSGLQSPSTASRPSSSRSLSRSRRKKRSTSTTSGEVATSKPASHRSQGSSEANRPLSQSSSLGSPTRSEEKPKMTSGTRSPKSSPRQSPQPPVQISGDLEIRPESNRSELTTENDDGDYPSPKTIERRYLDKESLEHVEKLKDEIKQMRIQRRKVKFGGSGPETPTTATATRSASESSAYTRTSRSPGLSGQQQLQGSKQARNYSMPSASASASDSSRGVSHTAPKPSKSETLLNKSNSGLPDFNMSIGAISIQDLDVGFIQTTSPKVHPATEEDKFASLYKKLKKTKKLIKRTTREVWIERDEIVNLQRNNWSIRKALVQADAPKDSVTTLNMKIEKLLRTEREIDEDMDRIHEEKESLETKCSTMTKAINTYKELLEKLNKEIVPLLPPPSQSAPSNQGPDVNNESGPLHFSPLPSEGRPVLGREFSLGDASLDDTLHSTEGDEDHHPFSSARHISNTAA